MLEVKFGSTSSLTASIKDQYKLYANNNYLIQTRYPVNDLLVKLMQSSLMLNQILLLAYL